MTGAIQVAAFDAYGTLFDVHSAAARLSPKLGQRGDALSATWRRKQLEYTWLRALMKRYVDFWSVTEEALDYAMDTVGFHDEAIRTELLSLYRTLDAYPEAVNVLEALRRGGIKTCILSNGAPSMLADAVKHAGLAPHLDAVLSVDTLGVYKPDPSVYTLADHHFGVEQANVAFMTANAWDAAGASTAGLRVIWVNRFGQPKERLPGDPDREIRSLSELPAVLVPGNET